MMLLCILLPSITLFLFLDKLLQAFSLYVEHVLYFFNYFFYMFLLFLFSYCGFNRNVITEDICLSSNYRLVWQKQSFSVSPQSFFLSSFVFVGTSVSSLVSVLVTARLMASHIPPINMAQKRFSNGANGSWIPNNMADNLKQTKKMTTPK